MPSSGLPGLIEDIVTKDSVARQVARAAKIDQAVAAGQLAYGGDFSGTGVIGSQYQDHGTGSNVMQYNHVDLSGYPYANWALFSGGAYTNLTDVALYNSTSLKQDAIKLTAAVGVYSTYRALFQHEILVSGQSYLYSFSARTHGIGTGAEPILVQFRAIEYPTYTDALNATSGVVIATSAEWASSGAVIRPRLAFTPATFGYVRFEHRAQRTSGAAGVLDSALLWNFMAEPVMLGQVEPSKFTLPLWDRKQVSVNILEGDALRGFVSGFEISRVSNTAIDISPGQCYSPGLGRVLNSTTTISVTVATGTPGIKYVYIYENNTGVIAADVTATVPDVAYTGTARAKSISTERRFVGVIAVYGGIVAPFIDADGYFTYQDDYDARLVASGSATTNTPVDLTAYIPDFTRIADVSVRMVYASAATTAEVGTNGNNLTTGEGTIQAQVNVNTNRARERGIVRTNAVHEIAYANANAGATTYIHIMGFFYER